METFLRGVLPNLMPDGCSFECHTFQGKRDLLAKLPNRLRAYAGWLPLESRLVVLVDADQDDCRDLKRRLEGMASAANLRSRSQTGAARWQLVNRIAIEELEAWYFGSWEAVRQAYPKVPATVPQRARFRQSDAIRGGTWEAFGRILQRHGYFMTGLRKIEAARAVAGHVDPWNSRSPSFRRFRDAIVEAVG